MYQANGFEFLWRKRFIGIQIFNHSSSRSRGYDNGCWRMILRKKSNPQLLDNTLLERLLRNPKEIFPIETRCSSIFRSFEDDVSRLKRKVGLSNYRHR